MVDSDAPPPAVSPGGTEPEPRRRRPRSGARLLLGISIMGLVTLGAATVGLIFFAGGGLGGGGGTSSGEPEFLEVRIDGRISDAPGDVGLALDPKAFPPLLTEITANIRRAATDEEVKGLYLEISQVSGGWASVQELYDAVAAFSASGKPCYAYGETFDNKAYYLASACPEVYLAPAGLMLVNGFSLTSEYYADTFEKIGIHAQFEHVGDFKSAVEPFERTGPSEAASIATNTLLDGIYEQFVAGIATGRKMTPEQVNALVNDPPITPEAAVAAGMVTGLKYRDEVREGLAGEERTEIGDYKISPSAFSSNRRIAIVHAEGNIVSGNSGSPLFGGSFVGDRTISGILEDIREDDDIVAVVLRVNSPGGSGLASDAMWHDLQRTKAAGKPIVVSMGDYAASGGYYISANADRIIAEPGTLTGSIGVFGGKINLAGLYQKVGINLHTYKRGQLAEMLSPVTDFSDVERMKFRQFLEGFYQTFLQRVADGRKLELDKVHEVAQGRVWTGAQALERGLVDELGGLDVAIARARELASVPETETLDLERYPRRKTFVDTLMEDLQSDASVPVELAIPQVRRSLGTLEALDRVLSDGGVAAMMPGTIEIR